MNIIFLDYELSGFDRYAKEICEYLRELINDIHIYGVYVKGGGICEYDCFDEIVSLTDYKMDISRVFNQYNPDAVVTFAHRFVDYAFVIESKKINIKVFNFQHGVYMSDTVISRFEANTVLSVLRNKFEKAKIYLDCIYQMNKKSIVKTLGLCLQMIFGKDMYRTIHDRFGNLSNSDTSFIYGDYWKTYYKEHYYEFSDEFYVVGYPELEKSTANVSRDLFKNKDLPIMCYLAQTYVEDGIVSFTELSEFLKGLISLSEKCNIIIKFHPRSNKKLYEGVTDNKNICIWSEKDFPKADMYIGHNSTTIARAMYITDKTLIYPLSGDNNLFLKYAKYIASNIKELNETIDRMIIEDDKKDCANKLEECVKHNKSVGALKMTADIIAEHLSKGE